MTKHYDLVVIGTGTAAAGVASRCKAAGWQVAVIDHLPFGGTCALRGCDPKRVLVELADVVDEAQRLRRAGAAGEHSLRWDDMMRFKRSFTEPVSATTEQSFVKSGIDAYHGLARFCGSTSVDVNGEVLEGRFVLIATGAVPMRLGIPGEEHLATSTDFLELDELPKRIALAGGGFIAAEFSHVAERAGASVVVLEAADRMLMPFDPRSAANDRNGPRCACGWAGARSRTPQFVGGACRERRRPLEPQRVSSEHIQPSGLRGR
jgi:glutathione reductase (NADPH)